MTTFLDLWLLRPPSTGRGATLVDASELDKDERSRASAFITPADRLLYRSAHIALRRVLAAYTGCAPAEVAFVREPCSGCGDLHGRPVLAGPAGQPQFSLSHTKGLVLIAVAAERVGVDVERVPGAEVVEQCTPSLHPGEAVEVGAAPPDGRRAAFGQIWARKEAYLKGLGTGLNRDPKSDYLGADPVRRPVGWSVLDLACGPGHHGAVAVRTKLSAPGAVRELPAHALHAGYRLPPPWRPLPA
ncbi:4'-phosphopantetheinyl transferase superfamily protein [Streptomyces sp. B-S-A8]|uniref:4'-phosphopantetheinyl transferase superfamily protein n=1 Tax=Streptomyces solicavernae TaxID=3043614 RepID=A0ABT6RZV5_9ACTN|nr:4'-phosphopantetheinyl transferase superfamily protein [Streptomyces sp. B-S-A8]MDI3389974.1 4'-phosphopantetheinyl transferase superfamily protein [Streptomyces sp. B-S-A8]